ncbi:DDE_3 domain-containing protein [Trichonephila inaurata madagascariensis]|uniref:DDE_3 domain-containing protein n=1 Tax=Trichonephila inaurata madagascariensis TaxID=2747483 RepID=A0A8X6YP26_9ARAC|nr:DDE_3 domain-containing protein [Trichonephila inaurata madagascariensis]
MPKLKPQSIVVMDNASYHSVKKEKIPTSSWEKSAIQERLSEKKVTWNQDLIKIGLLQKVNQIKHLYNSYRVEEITEKFGHKILRLPPYHCELDPIEMIWRQVKGYVARENKTFKLKEIKELVTRGIEKVSTQNWTNCINHGIKKEKEMWEVDGFIDEIWENQNFIISVKSDSSDSDSEIMSADDL